MLFDRPATRSKIALPVYVMTDCRSLYDAAQKEKRTLIDILSIRETLASDGLKWIPTRLQKADGLTKRDPNPRFELTVFMGESKFSLVA